MSRGPEPRAAAQTSTLSGPRFAIYFVPAADSALYRFGASMLGYDGYSGGETGRPADLGIADEEWAELVVAPRAYGFHATLKAPFHLRAEADPAALVTAFDVFAAAPRAIPVLTPAVRIVKTFAAVALERDDPDLHALAAQCVREFDRFRAPLTAADRSRRLPGLSERQIAHLDRWGYPYVFNDFQFHMTLTGSIAADRGAALTALLEERFARFGLGDPIPLDRIALSRQENRNARFRIVRTASLRAE